ncbi:hypothetical protein BDC45DRAFT_564236 [Circinella umbellata]|nr:hypothetical protein BDC45DRAFT_564236 [Circinella umbellata]
MTEQQKRSSSHTTQVNNMNDNKIITQPMPRNGQERVAALKELGGTFKEGQRRVSKIATPTTSDTIPSFMDTKRIEELLKKPSKSLQEAGHEVALNDPNSVLADTSSLDPSLLKNNNKLI